MIVQNNAEHETKERSPIGVWFCDGCGRFHVKAGKVLLTFDKSEFADFSDSIFDCCSANLNPVDFSTIH